MIDSYKIIKKLGQGSYGTVYLGRNSAKENVAIKILNPIDPGRKLKDQEILVCRQIKIQQ